MLKIILQEELIFFLKEQKINFKTIITIIYKRFSRFNAFDVCISECTYTSNKYI